MAISAEFLKKLKEAKNKTARFGSKAYKLKEGKTKIRLVKPAGSDEFYHMLGVHWIKDSLNGKPQAVVGNSMICFDTPSKVEAAIEAASKVAADDDTVKLIAEWKARTTVLVTGIVREGADASSDVQVIELPQGCFSDMTTVIEEYALSGVDAFDAKDGVDFVIERRGSGLQTKYTVMAAPKSTPISAPASIPNLREYIEREFFRGDEPKALKVIETVTGISASSLALAGPSTTAARLAGSTVEGAVDLDADVGKAAEAKDPPWEEPAKPAAAAKVAEAPKTEAAKPAEAPATTAPASDATVSGMSEDDIDAMLAGL